MGTPFTLNKNQGFKANPNHQSKHQPRIPRNLGFWKENVLLESSSCYDWNTCPCLHQTCKQRVQRPSTKHMEVQAGTTSSGVPIAEGRNPAPPRKLWNDDRTVKTNKQLFLHGFNHFFKVLHDFIHPQYQRLSRHCPSKHQPTGCSSIMTPTNDVHNGLFAWQKVRNRNLSFPLIGGWIGGLV